MSREKKLKFEEALKRLEEIVTLLEDEKLPLEEALERYEEGIKLTRHCTKVLDAAEKKIEILSKIEGGELEAKPFTPEQGKDAAKAECRRKRTKTKSEESGEQFLF